MRVQQIRIPLYLNQLGIEAQRIQTQEMSMFTIFVCVL